MGLDMHIVAKRYIHLTNDNDLANRIGKIIGSFSDQHLGNRIIGLVFEIGYWRKANAIHRYFVNEFANGVDECQPIEVSRQGLDKLRDLCRAILVATNDGKNPEKGSDVLPTQEGFFFGSTEYDEGYIDDVKDTIGIIDKALSNPLFKDDGSVSFIYQASW